CWYWPCCSDRTGPEGCVSAGGFAELIEPILIERCRTGRRRCRSVDGLARHRVHGRRRVPAQHPKPEQPSPVMSRRDRGILLYVEPVETRTQRHTTGAV